MSEWLAYVGVELNIIPHLAMRLVAYVLALPIGWELEQKSGAPDCTRFLWSRSHPSDLSRQPRRSPPATRKRQCKLGTRGTATAASIWATGAIGVAVGLGSYDTALVLSIATFATLRLMTPFKSSKNEVLPPPDKS